MAATVFLTVTFSFMALCDGMVLGATNPTVTPTHLSSFQFLEDMFLKERQILSQYVVNLEHQLNTKTLALEQKLNHTLEEVVNITQTLAVEKDKRVLLQQDYDRLVVDFYDLTVQHVDLKAKNHDLIVNNTKQDNEIRQLKETIQNLTGIVGNINVTAMTTSQTDVLALKNKTGMQVGFTADYPKAGPNTGTVRFSNVLTNIGNGYNTTSGQFTCPVSGLYHFALVIYKTAYADVASCFIRHNQSNKVEAFSSPPIPGGYFEASTTVVLYLKQGDTVDLVGCTLASHMESLTTFSGFLIAAD